MCVYVAEDIIKSGVGGTILYILTRSRIDDAVSL